MELTTNDVYLCCDLSEMAFNTPDDLEGFSVNAKTAAKEGGKKGDEEEQDS